MTPNIHSFRIKFIQHVLNILYVTKSVRNIGLTTSSFSTLGSRFYNILVFLNNKPVVFALLIYLQNSFIWYNRIYMTFHHMSLEFINHFKSSTMPKREQKAFKMQLIGEYFMIICRNKKDSLLFYYFDRVLQLQIYKFEI